MQNPEYIKNVMDQNRELMKNNNKLNNQINILQNQISENEHYTNLGKACYSSSDNITLNLLCKIIQNVLPFNFGLHALMEHLKFDGFLMRQPVNNNIISQKSLNMGLMTMIYDDNNVSYYPMVTPKGINFFINYFLKKFNLQENI